jgi:FAD/FMN-containing dehydrogenase
MTTELKNHPDLVSQLKNLLPGSLIITEPAGLATSVSTSPVAQPGQPPACIVKPANPHELHALICHANETGLNLTVTSSTGAHRNGGINNPGENMLIDLSDWKKTDLIDRRNRVCRVEPGVTYGQLLAELAQHDMTLPISLAPRNGKSVLTSIMDRNPSTWSNKQWDTSDPVGSTEFYFGSGERFRSGAAGGPGEIEQQRQSGGAQKFSSGPSQTDFHRVVQGAQGTMGILTWITLRTELKSSLHKTLLIGSEHLEDLLPFVYATQRGLLGEQSFILDRKASALLMADGDADAFETILSTLPAYICLQKIAGFERLPRERLAFHLKEIKQFARDAKLHLVEKLGGVTADNLFARATQPCGDLDWRDTLRGNSLSIFFISTLDRMPAFSKIIENIAQEIGMPEVEIATYIQPIAQNHACQMEFILPYDPHSESEAGRMKQFERLAVIRLMEAGAFFNRPYGSAADLVWAQNPGNHQLLKTIKGIFDPKRVFQSNKWGL